MVGWGARPPDPIYFIGVDLGQAQDYSAIAILESGPTYQVRHLERMRGVPYPQVVDRLHSLVNCTELIGGQIHIVVDKTGVGAPVVDLLKEKKMDPVSITITGGDKPTTDARKSWRVPKRDLISNLLVLSQTERLQIAANLGEAQTLADELQNLRLKINLATAHDTYGAWRPGRHDDLVLAVALAAWWAENKPEPPLVYFGAYSVSI